MNNKSFTVKEVQAYLGDKWIVYYLPRESDLTAEEWYESLCKRFPNMKFRLVEGKMRVIKKS